MFGGALDDDATEPRVPVVWSAIVCHEEPLKTGPDKDKTPGLFSPTFKFTKVNDQT